MGTLLNGTLLVPRPQIRYARSIHFTTDISQFIITAKDARSVDQDYISSLVRNLVAGLTEPDNMSIACDSFHLGKFIRFLSVRTGTLSRAFY